MSDADRRPCHRCGDQHPIERMTEVDVTSEDVYYPAFIYFCPSCWAQQSEGESDQ